MSIDNQQYQPGDVVNGHQLSADGTTWEPVAAAVADHEPGNWFARHKVLTALGGGAIALVVLVGISSGSDSSPEEASAGEAAAAPAEEPAEAAAEEAAQEAPEEAAPEGIGSGIHRVGVDIQPGLYVATGSGYWERLAGASGEFDDIIANGNGSGGQTYVEILPTDQYFSTNRFSDWVPVTDSAGELATSFSGDGMYRVGIDIQPGTYQSSGEGYWERLSGASGQFENIIANGNGNGNAIVTIDSGDTFFSTSRFGEWTLVE